MRVVKYGAVFWVLALVYTTVSLLGGAKGIPAYNGLLEERARQKTNIEDLKRINLELESTRNALLYDRDTIRVYARDLGLGEEGEKFVRIVGLGQNREVPLFPGAVITAGERRSMDNQSICLIAVFAALAVFIAFLVQDVLDLNLVPEQRAPRLDPAGVAGGSAPLTAFRRTPRPLPPEPPFTGT
ncbi:MAG: septum formation initiator family protein [Treponema sp.]|jgi:cell division protein FtsB|nr:septum formation initiator family protein [Treponema sp.]